MIGGYETLEFYISSEVSTTYERIEPTNLYSAGPSFLLMGGCTQMLGECVRLPVLNVPRLVGNEVVGTPLLSSSRAPS